MGWAIGTHNGRDIGYGVPAICDSPKCSEEIDRGLSFVCGNEPYGGGKGCGLYFCHAHHAHNFHRCARCNKGRLPYPEKPDTLEWIYWKLKDDSWAEWRNDNPATVKLYERRVSELDASAVSKLDEFVKENL